MNRSTDKPTRSHQSEGQCLVHRRARDVGPVAAKARTNYERYVALARESVQVGDAVETENWLQHADHYFRMMRDPVS
jgi:hypothetical protein